MVIKVLMIPSCTFQTVALDGKSSFSVKTDARGRICG
jgi:hypothetical protein